MRNVNWRRAVAWTSLLVIIASILSATAIGVLVWRATCSSCNTPQFGRFEAVAAWSDDENAKADLLWNSILRKAIDRGTVSDQDVEVLRRHSLPAETTNVRQMASGIMAEFLLRDVDMSESARAAIFETHLVLLSDPDGHLRLSAVAQAHNSGLLVDARVREAVRALQYDTNDIIAQRVKRIDWSEYDEAG